MTVTIGRRELLVALGGMAAAWPLVARAQQPAMPVIGFLSSASAGPSADLLDALRQGLAESGLSKGKTSRSNIAGPTVDTIGCRALPPSR